MMPDNWKKVIKGLHAARRYLEDREYVDIGASPHIDAINDTLSLMKEQEPVEVIHHEAPYGYPYNTGKCPVCFQQLDEGDKFCRECGQAVNWK